MLPAGGTVGIPDAVGLRPDSIQIFCIILHQQGAGEGIAAGGNDGLHRLVLPDGQNAIGCHRHRVIARYRRILHVGKELLVFIKGVAGGLHQPALTGFPEDGFLSLPQRAGTHKRMPLCVHYALCPFSSIIYGIVQNRVGRHQIAAVYRFIAEPGDDCLFTVLGCCHIGGIYIAVTVNAVENLTFACHQDLGGGHQTVQTVCFRRIDPYGVRAVCLRHGRVSQFGRRHHNRLCPASVRLQFAAPEGGMLRGDPFHALIPVICGEIEDNGTVFHGQGPAGIRQNVFIKLSHRLLFALGPVCPAEQG